MAQNPNYVPPPAAPHVEHNDSAAGLLRRLADDLTTLFRKEVALATSEVSRSVSEAKQGIASLAIGGAVLFAGLIVLLSAVVLALAEVMDPWLAALIVGGIVSIAGFVMVNAGKRKLEPESLKPHLTQESLRQDREMLHRRAP